MKKRLQLFLIIGLSLFLSFHFKAVASHQVGSTITYQNLAPGTYLVSLNIYQSCSDPTVSPTQVLTLNAPGCNTGRTVTLNQTGPAQMGNPYCAALGVTCTPVGRPNYLDITYQATITFSAVEQTCSDWVLGFSPAGNSRELSANVVTPSGVYNETLLKLNGVINNSAQINLLDVPVPVFCFGQFTLYAINATDPDCDSLSYELVAPLVAPNTPVTYKPHTVAAGATIINPNPRPPYSNPFNPQTAIMPNVGTHYSPFFPLQAFQIDWSTQPGTVTPFFKFNTDRGQFQFIPTYFNPNTASTTSNKYFVTIQINEWRKINGVVTKVGAIRRDLQFRIEDCGGNSMPAMVPVLSSGHPIPQTDSIIYVQSGSFLNLKFQTTDANTGDQVSVQTDVTSVLPGAQFNVSPGNEPEITISWLATTNPACTQDYFFRVKLQDDACPVKGSTDYVYKVRVLNSPMAMAEVINNNPQFIAYPNPFEREVTFKIATGNAVASEIRIFTLLGQEIDQIGLKKFPINETEIRWENAAKFAAGTYVARLIHANKAVQTIKFTKL